MDKIYLVERKEFNIKIPALRCYLTYAGEIMTAGAINTGKHEYVGFNVWKDSDCIEIYIDTDSKEKFVTENFIGRWAE